jgi:hypothetical protein
MSGYEPGVVNTACNRGFHASSVGDYTFRFTEGVTDLYLESARWYCHEGQLGLSIATDRVQYI